MCKLIKVQFTNVYRHIVIYFVIFVILIAFKRCDGRILTVTEGEVLPLTFPYPCDNSKITFRYGNRLPSFDSADPESISLPSNQQLTIYNDTRNDNCSLYFIINPVMEDDAGTYILTVYKDGMFTSDNKVGLHVDYPPGKVSCELSSDFLDEDWLSLTCTASVGSLPGQIMCYQNDIRLPPMTSLGQNGRELSQRIWTRLEDHVIYCCSSSSIQVKDVSKCKDWEWNPFQERKLTNITDLHNDTVISMRPTTDLPSTIPINTFQQDQTCDNNSMFWKHVVMIVCIIFIVLFAITMITWLVSKSSYKIKFDLRNMSLRIMKDGRNIETPTSQITSETEMEVVSESDTFITDASNNGACFTPDMQTLSKCKKFPYLET